MKYGLVEISDMNDLELLSSYKSMQDAEKKRNLASEHPKFNRDQVIDNKMIKPMEFPPINPKFLELKNALIEEINKRNLTSDKENV